MAEFQNFRSALHGFNRQDVVNYIEYINKKHNSQIEQLNTQLQNALEALNRVPAQDTGLQAQLDEALARCAQLEEQIANSAENVELEAYRRAERAERKAQERAAQIYAQANAVLAEATTKVAAASGEMDAVVAELSARMEASKENLQSAMDALYAIRPEEE